MRGLSFILYDAKSNLHAVHDWSSWHVWAQEGAPPPTVPAHLNTD